MSTDNAYRRFTCVGPGGINCPCCAPDSGNKYRAKARKKIKRQAIKKELEAARRETLKDTHDPR